MVGLLKFLLQTAHFFSLVTNNTISSHRLHWQKNTICAESWDKSLAMVSLSFIFVIFMLPKSFIFYVLFHSMQVWFSRKFSHGGVFKHNAHKSIPKLHDRCLCLWDLKLREATWFNYLWISREKSLGLIICGWNWSLFCTLNGYSINSECFLLLRL